MECGGGGRGEGGGGGRGEGEVKGIQEDEDSASAAPQALVPNSLSAILHTRTTATRPLTEHRPS